MINAFDIALYTFFILVSVVAYVGLGAIVTAEIAKRRPELFRYGQEFFTLLAVIIIAIWPACLIAMMFAFALIPVRQAWQKRIK